MPLIVKNPEAPTPTLNITQPSETKDAEFAAAPVTPPKKRKRGRRKKLKKPKRFKTAFNFFQMHLQSTLFDQDVPKGKRAAHNELVSRIVGQKWKDLTEEERQPFEEKAHQDRHRYQKEYKEFRIKIQRLAEAGLAPSQITRPRRGRRRNTTTNTSASASAATASSAAGGRRRSAKPTTATASRSGIQNVNKKQRVQPVVASSPSREGKSTRSRAMKVSSNMTKDPSATKFAFKVDNDDGHQADCSSSKDKGTSDDDDMTTNTATASESSSYSFENHIVSRRSGRKHLGASAGVLSSRSQVSVLSSYYTLDHGLTTTTTIFEAANTSAGDVSASYYERKMKRDASEEAVRNVLSDEFSPECWNLDIYKGITPASGNSKDDEEECDSDELVMNHPKRARRHQQQRLSSFDDEFPAWNRFLTQNNKSGVIKKNEALFLPSFSQSMQTLSPALGSQTLQDCAFVSDLEGLKGCFELGGGKPESTDTDNIMSSIENIDSFWKETDSRELVS
mmetsp:Transcript_16562/g.23152  ORF Transcript_16562/g.23152 Transcript_16562/m.23152 type:complete len:507 (+) Transcript_16562:282-1802(+)